MTFRRCLALVLVLAAAQAAVAAPARAQGPEFIPLAQGAFPSLASTWQALATRPNVSLFDIYDADGILRDSYANTWLSPVGKRRLAAVGYRPYGLPSAAAYVHGIAGRKVTRVKVFFAGAAMQKVPTVKAPPEWGFGSRFFAAGTTLPDAAAATLQAVTQIKALDRKGRLVGKLTSFFTNPF
jgi:hypothetical protein